MPVGLTELWEVQRGSGLGATHPDQLPYSGHTDRQQEMAPVTASKTWLGGKPGRCPDSWV